MSQRVSESLSQSASQPASGSIFISSDNKGTRGAIYHMELRGQASFAPVIIKLAVRWLRTKVSKVNLIEVATLSLLATMSMSLCCYTIFYAVTELQSYGVAKLRSDQWQ